MMMLASAAKAQVPDVGAGGIGGFGNVNPLTGLPIAQTPPLVYGADVGLAETDNVTLASTDKITQTIATTDFDFSVAQRSRLLDVFAKGDFSDLVYLQGAYGNEFIGRFDALSQVAIIPERLTWTLRDDFGQASLDAFTPVTPNNRQNINYVSTGPNLYLRLGGTGFVTATARYANAYYQTSPFDGNRGLLTLATGLQLSGSSLVSLNGAGERVLFDNTVANSDFDRYSVYGHYEAHGARTNLAVNLGATRVDENALAPTTTLVNEPPDSNNQVVVPVPGHPAMTNTDPLARLEFGRALSPSIKMTLTAGRELTDAASSFSSQQGSIVSAISFAPTPLSTDSYVETYGSAAWQYVRHRTTVQLTGRWERDRYPGAPQFDYTNEGVDFNVQRRLMTGLTAQLLGRWAKVDYPNATVASNLGSPESTTKQIGAGLVWRHGRWLEVRLRYDHTSYSAAQGDFGYSENRVLLTVGYRPWDTTLEPGGPPEIDQ
jgi:hypothetical protein